MEKNSSKIYSLILFIIFLFLLFIAPFVLSDFRLNLLAKYLAFAILAIGLDLLWGYTGILSLGHGVFFGLGAYVMAMYLSLDTTGGKMPDFMVWSGLERLPWFWSPFQYAWFAIPMVVLLPMIVSSIIGFLTFRTRIKGVYFTILSQALVIVMVTLFIGQQTYTGGTNGITGFKTIFGFSLDLNSTKIILYWITVAFLLFSYLFSKWLISSKFGKLLIAIRDSEERLRFLGYNTSLYKTAIYSISAGFAGLGGALFTLHVGIISPASIGIVPSIEMVLWVALGGRGTLIGAILGTLIVNSGKTYFSELYPDFWTILLGFLFIFVVLLFPNGLVGLMKEGFIRLKKGEGQHVREEKSSLM